MQKAAKKNREKKIVREFPSLIILIRSHALTFGRCIITRVTLLMLICLCVIVYPLHAQTIELGNKSLSVGVAEKHGYISHWQPKPLNSTMQQMHDFAGQAQKILQLDGVIGGEELHDLTQQLGGWQLVDKTTDFAHLKLVNKERGYEVHQSLQLDRALPWQSNYSVWLSASNSASIDASLWVDIGPGLGEEPTQGLGAAQSLYSFTEGVVGSGDDVIRLSAPPSVTSAEYQAQPDWFGLQTRYYAFVVAPSTRVGAWELTAPVSPMWYRAHPEFEQTMRVELPKLAANQDPIQIQIFGGGKSYSVLKAAELSLHELLFPNLWRWMRALTIGLMFVIDALCVFVGNWGLAILLLAVLVRLLIYPISKHTMAAQRQFVELQKKIQPELQAITQQYQGAEQAEAILQLYEKHNASPLAGLKPLLTLLLQLPIFVAIYHLLGQHFELRDQPFLWIPSLAEPDQLFSFGFDVPFFGSYFNLLPAFMVLTTLLTIKLSPAPFADDKAGWKQNLMLAVLAFVFFVLFNAFPSGMVLYWTAANVLYLLHAAVTKKISGKSA